jgi:hypothetical protein
VEVVAGILQIDILVVEVVDFMGEGVAVVILMVLQIFFNLISQPE